MTQFLRTWMQKQTLRKITRNRERVSEIVDKIEEAAKHERAAHDEALRHITAGQLDLAKEKIEEMIRIQNTIIELGQKARMPEPFFSRMELEHADMNVRLHAIKAEYFRKKHQLVLQHIETPENGNLKQS